MSEPAPPGGPTVDRRFSPQDWSLRVKLAIALLVPSLIAVVLGGLRIADQAGEAAEYDRIAQVSSAQSEVSKLVKRLQEERLRTTEFIVAGRTGDTGALQSSFAEVDAEQEAVRPIVQGVYPDDAAVVGAHRQAEQALALLPQLRELVLRSDSPAATAVARYSEVIEQVLPLDGALLRGVNSTEVNGLANALSGLSSARNEATLQQATIAAATSAREPNGGELSGLLSSEARLVTSLNNYRTALDTAQRVRFAELIAGPANSDRGALVNELRTADPARPLPGGTGVRASKVYGDFLAELDAAETGIRDELASTTQEARSTSVNLAVINVAVLLAALVIGAIIVGLIARAIISSLRTLRGSALEVAQKSLPDAVARMRGGTVPDVNVTPVPVHTREEVGEVARAFDAVHEQAVRLAAEQATLQNTVNSMFVNLSRRSQSLVDRQLQLIEELESNEQDPDQLASLFRLDHLATRMRRNSENLLVLAGTDLAKRSAHHVPVVDVLQAAVSEVEQYERVTVEQPPSVTVLGRAANDLQHLLSELLDNATSFSPPETQVTMSTSRAGNGPLVVEIIDRGIGMRPDELEDINKRFADADDSRMTASRRMGLFVVGRLAARHGVQVRLIAGAPTPDPAAAETGPLSTAKGTGVTARVTIPAHLVTSGTGGARRPEQSRSGTAPGRPAGAAQPAIMVPPQRGSSDRPRVSPAPDHAPDRVPGGTGARPAAGPARNGSGAGVGPETPPVPPSATPLPVVGAPGPGQRTPAEPEPETTTDPARPAADATPAAPAPAETAGRGPDGGRVNGSGHGGPAAPSRVIANPLWPADGADPVAGPSAADTEASIAAPELFGPSPVLDSDDAPTTRTPIFEEVASGWFRAYRQVPINWQPDLDGVVPDDIDRSQPVRPSALAQAPAPVPAPAPAVTAPPEDSAPVPPSWPPVRPAAVADDFATAADEGWRAAVEARRDSPPMDVVPGTDLPRRTPGAQLLPGGIASGSPAGSARDAAAIRSRLSNYQRGVRSGRTDRTRSDLDDGASKPGSVADAPSAVGPAGRAPRRPAGPSVDSTGAGPDAAGAGSRGRAEGAGPDGSMGSKSGPGSAPAADAPAGRPVRSGAGRPGGGAAGATDSGTGPGRSSGTGGPARDGAGPTPASRGPATGAPQGAGERAAGNAGRGPVSPGRGTPGERAASDPTAATGSGSGPGERSAAAAGTTATGSASARPRAAGSAAPTAGGARPASSRAVDAGASGDGRPGAPANGLGVSNAPAAGAGGVGSETPANEPAGRGAVTRTTGTRTTGTGTSGTRTPGTGTPDTRTPGTGTTGTGSTGRAGVRAADQTAGAPTPASPPAGATGTPAAGPAAPARRSTTTGRHELISRPRPATEGAAADTGGPAEQPDQPSGESTEPGARGG